MTQNTKDTIFLGLCLLFLGAVTALVSSPVSSSEAKAEPAAASTPTSAPLQTIADAAYARAGVDELRLQLLQAEIRAGLLEKRIEQLEGRR